MRRLMSGLLAGLLVIGCAALPPAGAPAPTLADPAAEGTALVNRYFEYVRDKDVEGLRALLSPAFQVARPDGSGHGVETYLARLPDLLTWELSDMIATQEGSVLVLRYMADATGQIEGQPYTPGPAPRLTVFVWDGTSWRLASHANFNPLQG